MRGQAAVQHPIDRLLEPAARLTELGIGYEQDALLGFEVAAHGRSACRLGQARHDLEPQGLVWREAQRREEGQRIL
jgi:hypothetical protein